MKNINTIVAELTEEEYDKASAFKNSQIGKVTWKDMIFDYIVLKKTMDESNSK